MKKIAILGLFLIVGCGGTPSPTPAPANTYTVVGGGITIEGTLKLGAKVSSDVYKAGLTQAIKKR